jgi:hypothetical protein
MPGRWPRKVDYTSDSSASVVAAVVVLIFGHVDDKEQTLGGLWCWRRFGSGSPGSCVGGYIGDIRHGRKTWSHLKVFWGESLIRLKRIYNF